jgi:cell division protein FtsN
VCIIGIAHLVSAKPAGPMQNSTAAATTPAHSTTSPTSPTAALPPSPAVTTRPAATSVPPAAAAHAPGWYVIAWTYNHSSQAKTKADSINARFHGFHAEVFSPHGRATFLVSLGGPMTEPQAKALQQRARQSGLPRDTYIRNYR